MKKKDLPLIYSCSGCSSAAQLANAVAVSMDRKGKGEMSCVSGLGGDVKSLIAKAKRAKSIIAIDGCALKCSEACINRHGLKIAKHYNLAEFEVSKKFHEDFDPQEVDRICEIVESDLKKAS